LRTKGQYASSYGWTPLHVAAIADRAPIAKLLLAAAPMSTRDARANSTPLHYADGTECEMTALLLACNAGPRRKDGDSDTLDLAKKKDRGSGQVVKRLSIVARNNGTRRTRTVSDYAVVLNAVSECGYAEQSVSLDRAASRVIWFNVTRAPGEVNFPVRIKPPSPEVLLRLIGCRCNAVSTSGGLSGFVLLNSNGVGERLVGVCHIRSSVRRSGRFDACGGTGRSDGGPATRPAAPEAASRFLAWRGVKFRRGCGPELGRCAVGGRRR